MRIVKTKDYADLTEVKPLLARPHVDEVEVSPQALERTKQIFGEPLTPLQSVERILSDIRRSGDAGLLRYIDKIDGQRLRADELLVSEAEYAAAERTVSPKFRESLERAAERVQAFHERQRENSWFATEADGVIVGQRVIPLDRVGLYVPGGNAPLVSSVLMGALPPQAAGVGEVWMATPLRDGQVDPHLLVAAQACGVTNVVKAGGAQAIGALAFGTETVPGVDKIVGPGNLYVTLAKKLVYGRVGIESLAGPSEILVLADETADPRYVAADMLSQAEHDWDAASCLITTSESLAAAVESELQRQLALLPTAAVAGESLDRWGLLVVAKDMNEAVELTNIFAAEHLELMVERPWEVLGGIRHAGAVFIGPYSAEPIGDYVAGPNHILPTNGTARFSSPLTTNDFVKKSSVISYSAAGLLHDGPHAVCLANTEGLAAHSESVAVRLRDLKAGGNDA